MVFSVGQKVPWSSVRNSLGFPYRTEDAGGKIRKTSLITAVVYDNEFTIFGCCSSMVAAAGICVPNTESCSDRKRPRIWGWLDNE